MRKIFETLRGYLYRILGGSGLTIIDTCDEEAVQDYIRDPFSNSSFCLAMQKRADATKSVKLSVFTGEGENKKEIPNHSLSILSEYVSSTVSYGDFIDYVLNWSIAKDKGCLIRKVSGLSWLAPDLRVYHPDNFNIHFNGTEISRIEIINPGENISDQNEIKNNFLWIKSANYYQEVAGISPNSYGKGLSNQNSMGILGSFIKKVWTWNWKLSKNSGKINGVISGGSGHLTKEDREEIRDRYAAMTSGNNNGKPLILSGDAKYQDTSKSPIEADWLNGEKTAHERICLSVGVPPELVGGGQSTYANRKEAKKELYTDTVIPWMQDLVNHLNKLFAKELKGAYFDIKISHIEALKLDKAEELKALDSIKDRLTVNEYRKAAAEITGLKIEDIKGGDVIVIGTETLENLSTPIGGSGNEKEDDI